MIDGHEAVFRFDNAPTISRYGPDVGERTTYQVSVWEYIELFLSNTKICAQKPKSAHTISGFGLKRKDDLPGAQCLVEQLSFSSTHTCPQPRRVPPIFGPDCSSSSAITAR